MQVSVNNQHFIITDPDICPHCHIKIIPSNRGYYFSKGDVALEQLIVIYQCVNSECTRHFVALYKKESNQYKFKQYLNGLPKGPNWPKPIIELKSGEQVESGETAKSKFIKTYLQSLQAENLSLDEIAGMGYRKAIEYLVKDWAIKENPDKRDEILKSWLGNVIQNYFTGDLKDILERATWLGNDQSHYLKLFSDFDLDVLKELISLIMVELDRQYKKNHFIESIQSKKLQ